ncbi:nicotinate-nucleotide adenylyltransferase [Pseudoalteromonas ruthenica]|uniref:nicotinate-nucleotide adenylyltransferase n=1 Tax=Pseudoalteromonas ruthenica TaxID=151081 RepID=UPI001246C1C6|nr:nicotinate-nucleotide adenylyltransferase [Pseudoalteromonas ruthenica]|tara:strand:+ start:1860 stop:2501 length:642 start_codon:yes stop_codon:yes gene_type:complete
MLLFGGTFDPVHIGHLNMANQCLNHFNSEQLFFMPNRVPAHKQASNISNADKLAMLRLAIASEPRFKIDERELHREGPSYSLLSLQELREELDSAGNYQEPILFLMGLDSFNSFDSWYQWQQITSLCHLVVYQRPQERLDLSATLTQYLSQHQCQQGAALNNQRSGLVYFLPGPQLAVSSSEVRAKLQRQQPCEELLTPPVYQYIRDKRLYIG